MVQSGAVCGLVRAMRAVRARAGPADARGGALAAAEFAGRCAVLLRGGLAPDRALRAAALETPGAPIELIGHLDRGASAAEALRAATADPDWRLVAAAWTLAERSGAPLAPALERISAALHDLVRMRGRRATLLAGPRMTVRMVASLPPLALLLGAALGFDPIPVLVGPAGALLLAVGTALLVAGIAWARSLTRTVADRDRVAAVEFELVWIVLSGGAGPGEALVRVADCVSDLRVAWVRFDELCAGRPLRRTLAGAARAGVPVATLLLEEAEAVRGRALADLESEAERLGVRVLVPLGVCVLPAFIALGVMPVLLSMLGGVG
ncbi:type II secretion system F family protein [Leucobacter sp. gxy201]|uniref:type II secretion system F family protein n=1 Tax=Leucobacter sp. gxy201 TaxID=2957200 RepID=UPI003DA1627B